MGERGGPCILRLAELPNNPEMLLRLRYKEFLSPAYGPL